MKIKKYIAQTEQEAINQIKDELGKEAIILNIRKIHPKGIYKLFNKSRVEVTAALDERQETNQYQAKKSFDDYLQQPKHSIVKEQEETIKSLESKIDNLESLLTKVVEKVSYTNQKNIDQENRKFNSTILQFFYSNLLQNEVLPEVCEKILMNLDDLDQNNETSINKMIGIVYNRLIEMLGTPEPIEVYPNEPNIIVFIGPTGVGKTTTIAKITAHFSLHEKEDVGLITADTYRIAAVEQLKTYAEILGVPVEVIYSSEELESALDTYKQKTMILIDTAGRSHKNKTQFEEMQDMLGFFPSKRVYLVMSMTTKYKDMVKILEAYSAITDYGIIFTKMDETTSLGNILNIRYLTGQPLSYIAFGQNVPDDIEVIDPQKIAKLLLGSYE